MHKPPAPATLTPPPSRNEAERAYALPVALRVGLGRG
jgi:hypothetical protein